MIKNLPRELLWTDMKDISEMKSNKLRRQLYGVISMNQALYSSAWSELDDETMLKLYNEAFYFCTHIVYEHDADSSPETYMEEIMSNLGDKKMSYLVACLMFYILWLQSNKSDVVVHFTDKLRKAYLSHTTSIFLNLANKWFKPRKNRVDLLLKPCPYPAGELQNIPLDWHKITKGFSKNIIVELLDLWDSEDEKGKVIRLIENAYQSCKPVSANDERADKANDKFFSQQKNLYNITEDNKEEGTSKDKSLVTLSVVSIFKHDNAFVRDAVKCIVEKFYRGQAVNLALIEIVLSDHKQLKDRRRTCHKLFVKVLKEWGVLSQDLDVKRTANGMSQKIRKINNLEGTPDKHYIDWCNCLRDRQKCISIGDELSKLLEYSE